MDRGRIALVGSLALAVVAVWAVVAMVMLPAFDGTAVASPATSIPTPTASSSLATDAPSMTAEVTAPPATAEPTASPTAAPTAAPTPTIEPTPTGDDIEPTDPRLAYAEFLVRLDAARAEVEDLNETIVVAAEAGDQATVRASGVDILQFADRERDWLLAHPPAACYADAHGAAGAMLEAYAAVAERAIDWADADSGLEALDALADVLTATGDARSALEALTAGLESTTCRA